MSCLYYRLFAAEGEEGGEDPACENSMPRAATASARAFFSSPTSTAPAASLAGAGGGVVSGLASDLSEAALVVADDEESDTLVAAGATTAGVGGADATVELGALVRRCWCWCCLDASGPSSSEVGVRLGWRLLLLLPLLPLLLPEADLAVAAPALAEVGGHGLELDGLLPLCPMNMRIWVYLGLARKGGGGGEVEPQLDWCRSSVLYSMKVHPR